MASHYLALIPPLSLVALFGDANLAAQTTIDYRDPAVLARELEQAPERFVLIDVRTAEEYRDGHIPGAINIHFRQIGQEMANEDRAQVVVVYCTRGRRSGIAAIRLRSMGYRNVHDFGGIGRWSGPLVQEG